MTKFKSACLFAVLVAAFFCDPKKASPQGVGGPPTKAQAAAAYAAATDAYNTIRVDLTSATTVYNADNATLLSYWNVYQASLSNFDEDQQATINALFAEAASAITAEQGNLTDAGGWYDSGQALRVSAIAAWYDADYPDCYYDSNDAVACFSTGETCLAIAASNSASANSYLDSISTWIYGF